MWVICFIYRCLSFFKKNSNTLKRIKFPMKARKTGCSLVIVLAKFSMVPICTELIQLEQHWVSFPSCYFVIVCFFVIYYSICPKSTIISIISKLKPCLHRNVNAAMSTSFIIISFLCWIHVFSASFHLIYDCALFLLYINLFLFVLMNADFFFLKKRTQCMESTPPDNHLCQFYSVIKTSRNIF